MKCPYCSKEITDRSIFCPECGQIIPEQKKFQEASQYDSNNHDVHSGENECECKAAEDRVEEKHKWNRLSGTLALSLAVVAALLVSIVLIVSSTVNRKMNVPLDDRQGNEAMEDVSDTRYSEDVIETNVLPQVAESQALNYGQSQMENAIPEEASSELSDPNCEHIFEVLNGKDGIETKCRFCGISMEALNDAGIVLEDKNCECEYEPIIQTNGTPAFECKKCHQIQIMSIAPLTRLKKLADTNAKGKDKDVKLGDFYEKGEELTDMIRFWVSDKSGYENSESIDLYLANSYSNILGHVFAGDDCEPNTNMTLRFYGDGVLLDEIKNITMDDDFPVEVKVTDVEVLRIECITDVSDFGYCFIQASAWY